MSPHQLGNFATVYESWRSVADFESTPSTETLKNLHEATEKFIQAIKEYNEERSRHGRQEVMLNQLVYIPCFDDLLKIDTRLLKDELTTKVLTPVDKND